VPGRPARLKTPDATFPSAPVNEPRSWPKIFAFRANSPKARRAMPPPRTGARARGLDWVNGPGRRSAPLPVPEFAIDENGSPAGEGGRDEVSRRSNHFLSIFCE